METKVHNEVKSRYARDFILAGKANVTFHSDSTGNSYRYYVYKKTGTEVWFVYQCLKDGDNRYIGHIKADIWFPKYLKGIVDGRAAQDVFDYTWRMILQNQVPKALHILHDGHCSYCSRPLSDAVSLLTGIGPICRKKLGLTDGTL